MCTKKTVIIAIIFSVVLFMLGHKQIVQAEEGDNHILIIQDYYSLINEGQAEEIQNLYGNDLKSFVSPFFANPYNKINQEGIFNVIQAEIAFIQPLVENEQVSDLKQNVNTYLVKCDMDVSNMDEFYLEGVNYFKFYIGEEEGVVKILNIEIPTYNEIKRYDNTDDATHFVSVRNALIYGEEIMPLQDRPAYIDYVSIPKKIKVEGYGEMDFWGYCEVVAANEINTLSTDDAARAGAMAIKMYSMHAVNTASGTNYHVTKTQQKYDPATKISTRAQNAMDYIKDYYMLGGYGENFKSFYYTQYNANTTVGKYCYQNGGVLSHVETNQLGKDGKTWKEILRYYYDKKTGVEYIPLARESASIIITTAHTHDWSNGYYCPFCGAQVY